MASSKSATAASASPFSLCAVPRLVNALAFFGSSLIASS